MTNPIDAIADRDAAAYRLALKDAIGYAAKRRDETGCAYIVSDFPRVLWDCPDNRRVLRDLGEQIIFTAR